MSLTSGLLGLGLVRAVAGAGSLAGFAGGASSIGVVVALVVVVLRGDSGVLRGRKDGSLGRSRVAVLEEEVLDEATVGECAGNIHDLVDADLGDPHLEEAGLSSGPLREGHGLLVEGGRGHGASRAGSILGLVDRSSRSILGLMDGGRSILGRGRGRLLVVGGPMDGSVRSGRPGRSSRLETSQVLVAGIVAVL